MLLLLPPLLLLLCPPLHFTVLSLYCNERIMLLLLPLLPLPHLTSDRLT